MRLPCRASMALISYQIMASPVFSKPGCNHWPRFVSYVSSRSSTAATLWAEPMVVS